MGNFQLLTFVGPAPGLQWKLHFSMYQGQNDSTKSQKVGSISALSIYYTTTFLK